MVLNPGDESGVLERSLSCGYADCSGDPESEDQSLVSPNRPRDRSDSNRGGFLAVSQITKTVRNGRPIWAVGLSHPKWRPDWTL